MTGTSGFMFSANLSERKGGKRERKIVKIVKIKKGLVKPSALLCSYNLLQET
jgi:hypothetical protein